MCLAVGRTDEVRSIFFLDVPPKRRAHSATGAVLWAVEAPRTLGRSPGAMSPRVAISLLNAWALWRDRGGESEGADIVRRLQVSAGRFLPETLGNRRLLHRAVHKHRFGAIPKIIVPFLKKLFLFWALNSKRFEKMSRFAASAQCILGAKKLWQKIRRRS